jgi:hypothetical protein
MILSLIDTRIARWYGNIAASVTYPSYDEEFPMKTAVLSLVLLPVAIPDEKLLYQVCQ